MPDAGQSNSMHVIYESPDANHETVAPDAPVAPPPVEAPDKTPEATSSGLADLFAQAEDPSSSKRKKKKKAGLAIAGSPGEGIRLRRRCAGRFFDRSGHPARLPSVLGYRLYEGWYNDYFTKQLAGQVQTGLDESAWADIRAKYPNVNFPEGMNPAYAALYAANQEMVGWLKIPNMKYIDFPIVQGKDNDKYLKLDYYGRTTSYGNPFLDFRNNIKELDRNTIIFGHHMRSGDQVFSELTDYLTIDGFKRNPVIEYNTLYADYQWKVYAVFLTNSKAEHDNGYIFNYIFTNLSSDDKFKEYISEIDQRKLYSTGVDIRPDDKILTLSTCNYDWDEQRLVVVARLVREGEDASVDTSLAKKNENPRYPQIYYDKKGIANPYRDAEKWKP